MPCEQVRAKGHKTAMRRSCICGSCGGLPAHALLTRFTDFQAQPWGAACMAVFADVKTVSAGALMTGAKLFLLWSSFAATA